MVLLTPADLSSGQVHRTLKLIARLDTAQVLARVARGVKCLGTSGSGSQVVIGVQSLGDVLRIPSRGDVGDCMRQTLSACQYMVSMMSSCIKAVERLSDQLAMSYFMPLCLTLSAMMARISALSRELLVSLVNTYNNLSSLLPLTLPGCLGPTQCGSRDVRGWQTNYEDLPMRVSCKWGGALPELRKVFGQGADSLAVRTTKAHEDFSIMEVLARPAREGPHHPSPPPNFENAMAPGDQVVDLSRVQPVDIFFDLGPSTGVSKIDSSQSGDILYNRVQFRGLTLGQEASAGRGPLQEGPRPQSKQDTLVAAPATTSEATYTGAPGASGPERLREDISGAWAARAVIGRQAVLTSGQHSSPSPSNPQPARTSEKALEGKDGVHIVDSIMAGKSTRGVGCRTAVPIGPSPQRVPLPQLVFKRGPPSGAERPPVANLGVDDAGRFKFNPHGVSACPGNVDKTSVSGASEAGPGGGGARPVLDEALGVPTSGLRSGVAWLAGQEEGDEVLGGASGTGRGGPISMGVGYGSAAAAAGRSYLKRRRVEGHLGPHTSSGEVSGVSAEEFPTRDSGGLLVKVGAGSEGKAWTEVGAVGGLDTDPSLDYAGRSRVSSVFSLGSSEVVRTRPTGPVSRRGARVGQLRGQVQLAAPGSSERGPSTRVKEAEGQGEVDNILSMLLGT